METEDKKSKNDILFLIREDNSHRYTNRSTASGSKKQLHSSGFVKSSNERTNPSQSDCGSCPNRWEYNTKASQPVQRQNIRRHKPDVTNLGIVEPFYDSKLKHDRT